jgi:hypothetical protein
VPIPESRHRSRARIRRSVRRELRLLERLAHFVGSGVARWPPSAKRSRCTAASSASNTAPVRGARDAERGVELVHLTIRRDASVVFAGAAAAEESRLALVAGARVDLHGGKMRTTEDGKTGGRSVSLPLRPPDLPTADYISARELTPRRYHDHRRRPHRAVRRLLRRHARGVLPSDRRAAARWAASCRRSIRRNTSSTSRAFRAWSPRTW